MSQLVVTLASLRSWAPTRPPSTSAEPTSTAAPSPLAEGGRLLYAVVPTWLSHYGYPQADKSGRRLVFLIPGNLPGRRDAGRIWQGKFDAFLHGYGLRQCVPDRRVWTCDGLIIHDTSTTPASPPSLLKLGLTSTTTGPPTSVSPRPRTSSTKTSLPPPPPPPPRRLRRGVVPRRAAQP